MPTLKEMQKQIEELVVSHGFANKPEDFERKLLFAFIELGESANDYKKGDRLIGPDKKYNTKEEWKEGVCEELIDAVFYILDGARVFAPEVDMDEVFNKKQAKNMGRPYRYGEGSHLKAKV